jgi:flagellar hook assembly protein FlgD
VQLDVVDLSGRRVRHLANGRFAPGTHEFSWDGRDDSGRSMGPGAYFIAGSVGEARVAQRLILLR